jgi:hypothetical protein
MLVPAGLVSGSSLIEVYRSLLSVVDEVGGGGDRAERAIRAVSEGLMRVSLSFVIRAHISVWSKSLQIGSGRCGWNRQSNRIGHSESTKQ